ncbi:alpha/beta hydrolase [Luteimonas sp. BDR2-5]|uniref:alpha/beta fold hydrolase n=1 Tax=Proluteimonas luteida TaxID=2878685 RepID=UPI001E2DCB25|nr:alpha/beta fold hydrolase [Luteimonas sp. BDR2-5]MCD9027265.1 alpha/beta hydrolase [Luteimonas sp. BDR2-5]
MTYAFPAWFAALLCGAALSAPAFAQSSTGGQQVQVGDMRMHYEEVGAGDALVLLHGFGGCGREWRAQAVRLAADYRVIMPDLRGHGGSTNPSDAFTHRQAAADLSALLDRLGVDRFKAIGISSGGMTLLHMATREPARVEAMVLVGTAHYFPEQARAITRRAAEAGPRLADLDYFRQCATRGETQVDALARQFAGFATSAGDVDFSPRSLGGIRARTLIVHGDRDEFFPPDIPVAMHAAIPDSALWIVPGGAHVPIHGARAQAFEDEVLHFLRDAPGAGGVAPSRPPR